MIFILANTITCTLPSLGISYSSLSMFKRSPLEYYFHKIIKEVPEKINSCYGDAGTAVHSGMRAYIEKGNGEDEFARDIAKVSKKGIHGENINFEKFRQCFEEGKKIVDAYKSDGYELFPEMSIEFKETFGVEESKTEVKVTGYIDLVLKKNDEVIILDWKTNSSLPEDGFIGQQEFYAYLYYKKYGVIPNKFVWVMLKNGNKVEHSYNIDVVNKIESEINGFVKYILDRGTDVSKYEQGDFEHIFNEHFTSCRREVAKRNNCILLDVEVYRNDMKFLNLKDMKLRKAIDIKFSFNPEGYEFSPKYQAGEWDGKIHMLRAGDKMAIGFYWMIQDFIKAYNDRFNLNYKLAFIDRRNKAVQDALFSTVYGEPPFELRYYQNEAVYAALKKKIGIIYIGTAGGKTGVTAEICKCINKRALVIINRLELIDQTAEAFGEYLGIDIGVMHEGNLNINNQITVASVQTIDAILKRNDETTRLLITYLFNVNVVCFDECQNVKDKSFYSTILKYTVNTDYILGFSGSPFRNPVEETLSMNALVGDIIYSKSTGDLEKENWIIPTQSFFIRPLNKDLPTTSSSYQEDYDIHVLNNSIRNKLIFEIVNKYKSMKKIIILTKYRKHNKILLELIPNSLCIDSFTPRKQRREIFNKFKSTRDLILISTIQLMASGINIPDMDVIINASATKSPIMTIQSIGRVKRKSSGKEFGIFVDFFDGDSDKLRAGSKKRIQILEEYKNTCKIIYNTNQLVM